MPMLIMPTTICSYEPPTYEFQMKNPSPPPEPLPPPVPPLLEPVWLEPPEAPEPPEPLAPFEPLEPVPRAGVEEDADGDTGAFVPESVPEGVDDAVAGFVGVEPLTAVVEPGWHAVRAAAPASRTAAEDRADFTFMAVDLRCGRSGCRNRAPCSVPNATVPPQLGTLERFRRP